MKKQTLEYISNNLDNLKNKLVIVTGANSGLGYEMCRVLLLKEAKVVMACRSSERAEKAKNKLLNEFPNREVSILLYDQSDLNSIDNLCDEIMKKYSGFYGLILNAGVLKNSDKKVKNDDYESVIKINAFGTIRIIEKLQQLLNETSSEKRIVFQSSITGRRKNKEKIEDIKGRCFGKMKGYAISKGILHAAFYYYSKNNQNSNVKYCLSEPGICNTSIIRNYPKWFQKVASLFLNIVCHDNTTGSLTSISLLNKKLDSNYLVPRHSGLKGRPFAGVFKEKYINNTIIEEIKKI